MAATKLIHKESLGGCSSNSIAGPVCLPLVARTLLSANMGP